MSSNSEIFVQDLPPELLQSSAPATVINYDISTNSQILPETDWKVMLEQWAKQALLAGQTGILTQTVTDVERILLKCALNFTRGHKQDAANLLGWGRNTLTRKLKELTDTPKNGH